MADCPQCRTRNPEEARYCMTCGGSLVEEPRIGHPEMIKLVTIMFADVVGSTAQAEHMSPDETRALMADFFQAMSEEIAAEGGTIERLVGDALLVNFGVPLAHEDDADRAVRAARRMLARLESWNATRSRRDQIQIRIGLNTGEVSTGGSLGEQLMVMGDAVNVAARLQQSAEPGTIVVGERTARIVRRNFQLSPGTPITARGKSQPVQSFLVEQELERVADAGILRAQIVGRDAELEVLRDSLKRVAREHLPHFVTIIGEPGVGKSRLLEEFTASLDAGQTVLNGHCLPYGDGITLSPLQEILRAQSSIFPADEPDVSLKKVESFVQDVVGDVPASEIASLSGALAGTIGVVTDPDALGGLDPRLVYREMVRAWRTMLTEMARRGPLVISVEDLYLADPTMLDVLTDLLDHVEGPILFLCTTRPDFVASNADWFSRLRSHSTLRIEPLGHSDSERLVAKLLGAADLPVDLTERVVTRAEGNPLFIEEIVLRLTDEGHLTERDGAWTLTTDASHLEVPERVQTLIQARLDLLSERERDLVQAGAVAGRTFWSGAVEHVTGFSDTRAILDDLKPRQMVIEQLSSAIPGEQEYDFRHLLIRDVAYESLPKKTRALYHARVAEWIESIRGARVEEAAELLADHYERAYLGLEEDRFRVSARRYYLTAAESGLRRFAVGQAERFGQHAVKLSKAGAERVEALETLGDAFYLALRGNPAWLAYKGAITELESMAERDNASLARLAAKATMVPTRWIGTMDEEVPADDVARLIDAGLQAAGEMDCRDRALLLSARAFLAGTAEKVVDPEPAERSAAEAVAMALRLDDPDLVSAAMDAQAVLLWPTGRFGEISRIDRSRVELVPQLADVREIADILLSAGRDLGKLGDFGEALTYLDRAAETVREIDVGQYLHVLVQRSQVRFMLGDWDGALADLDDVERLETAPDEGIPPYAGRAYGIGFFCHHLRGDPDAQRYLEMLRGYRHTIAEAWSEASGPFAVPARALALRGETDEALGWLSLKVSGFIRGEHLQALCDVIAIASDWERARAILTVARAEAANCELRPLGFFADRLEGCTSAANDELRDAVVYLSRSADGFAELQTSWEEAYSRLLLAEVFASAGSRRESEAQLSLALPVVERLGSIEEIGRARALLARV
ncbi:MAG: ATP-binding protein [Actinomycetota bacterium]